MGRRDQKNTAGQTRQGVITSALFEIAAVLAGLLFVAGALLSARVRPPAPDDIRPRLTVQPAAGEAGGLSVSEAIEAAAPSVVSIDLYTDAGLSPGGSASGVVLSADGYIATCAHVIRGYELIRVVLPTGEGRSALVIGTDPQTDLAVLKINGGGLTPASFGDSAGLRLGQQVVAIGNAAGILPGTPSVGIISGINRQVSITTTEDEIVLLDLLQTDAAINPGNSGGALVDMNGRVVGITVAKLEDANVENVGFAIPAQLAVPVLQRLINTGEPAGRARLGASVVALNETTGPPRGLPAQGLCITGLSAQSELAGLGVSAGDVLLEANGVELAATGDLLRVLSQCKPGDTVELLVFMAKTDETIAVNPTLYEAG